MKTIYPIMLIALESSVALHPSSKIKEPDSYYQILRIAEKALVYHFFLKCRVLLLWDSYFLFCMFAGKQHTSLYCCH